MKNDKIDKILFDGGYAQATSASSTTDKFAFNYYNQDHLGNNREVVDASGAVTQVTNYYPFGAPYADTTAVKGANLQPYKYNGKELDLMHGLNTFDYGACQYNPVTGRWDRMDPLCEKYYSTSPYVYCLNNPVRLIDPNGKDVTIIYTDGNGKIQNFKFDGTQSKCPNNSYVLAFIKTYNFLKSKGLGKNLVKAVTDHKYNIKLQNDDDGQGNAFNYEMNRVFWDPTHGKKFTNGGKQSAAVALEHEFDHAIDYNDHPTEYKNRRVIPDAQYDDAEERRVIEGSERLTVKALNEGIRYDHKGDYYITTLPTSTKEGIPHNFTRMRPVPNKPSLVQFIESLFH